MFVLTTFPGHHGSSNRVGRIKWGPCMDNSLDDIAERRRHLSETAIRLIEGGEHSAIRICRELARIRRNDRANSIVNISAAENRGRAPKGIFLPDGFPAFAEMRMGGAVVNMTYHATRPAIIDMLIGYIEMTGPYDVIVELYSEFGEHAIELLFCGGPVNTPYKVITSNIVGAEIATMLFELESMPTVTCMHLNNYRMLPLTIGRYQKPLFFSALSGIQNTKFATEMLSELPRSYPGLTCVHFEQMDKTHDFYIDMEDSVFAKSVKIDYGPREVFPVLSLDTPITLTIWSSVAA